MTFKSAVWYRIALVLSALNLIAVPFATEPWHTALHATLALAFGLWAQRLRERSSGTDFQARLEALEGELTNVRRELSETQERLDFAERLLARGPEPHRVDPGR